MVDGFLGKGVGKFMKRRYAGYLFPDKVMIYCDFTFNEEAYNSDLDKGSRKEITSQEYDLLVKEALKKASEVIGLKAKLKDTDYNSLQLEFTAKNTVHNLKSVFVGVYKSSVSSEEKGRVGVQKDKVYITPYFVLENFYLQERPGVEVDFMSWPEYIKELASEGNE